MNKHLDRPHPGELLTLAFETINARGDDYDNAADLAQNFREIAAVASVITGKTLEAQDIALIQHCVKLVRVKSCPEKLDNYVDGVNYLAFAACFRGLVPLPTPEPPPKPQRRTTVPPTVDAVKEPDYLR
jgi:Domain of unknown function (DUF6378)